MTLVNSAQDKKFAGADVTPVNKKFVAKSFYAVDERTVKSFSGEKDFSAKRFETEKFTRAEQTPNTQAKTKMASANAEFVTRKSSLVSDRFGRRQGGGNPRLRGWPAVSSGKGHGRRFSARKTNP